MLEAALWAVIYFRGGLMVFVDSRHAGLRSGIAFGTVFGFIWLVSFVAAWWIVWSEFKSYLPVAGN